MDSNIYHKLSFCSWFSSFELLYLDTPSILLFPWCIVQPSNWIVQGNNIVSTPILTSFASTVDDMCLSHILYLHVVLLLQLLYHKSLLLQSMFLFSLLWSPLVSFVLKVPAIYHWSASWCYTPIQERQEDMTASKLNHGYFSDTIWKTSITRSTGMSTT